MKTILAIDPGPIKSAFVLYHAKIERIIDHGILENKAMLRYVGAKSNRFLAIEMIKSYGKVVGDSVFETCLWIGRFIQTHESTNGRRTGDDSHRKIYRISDVKMHLCHNPTVKDAGIRQVIIDRYPPTGGGKTPQIGTKKQPGPLYGIRADEWQALAVALTVAEKYRDEL